MQIKQVYNKTTGKVLCCEIPWDVARQRTGKDVYCKVGQCIMLWPDRSLDLYDTKLRWIRKICDVGTEFDIVWAQFWEYHGLRGETGLHEGPQAIQNGQLGALLCQLAALG